MATKKASVSDAEARNIILRFFYDRGKQATSARGKAGFAVTMSDVKKSLKASHQLSQQQVVSNLHYLISQGWIEEDQVSKSVPLPSGTVIPQVTSYYKITAVGTDKVEGPSEFTMDKFRGIKIEATGQNIITVGDGNQVNAQHSEIAHALIDLRKAVVASASLNDAQKLDTASDIDSIESQLAKAAPNKTVISAAWEGVKKVGTVADVAMKVGKVAGLLAPYFG
jgi:hypothetical protein